MIVEQLAHILDQLGADWVLWLLIVLSVLSVAVVIERLIFLARNRVPVAEQAKPMRPKAKEDGADLEDEDADEPEENVLVDEDEDETDEILPSIDDEDPPAILAKDADESEEDESEDAAEVPLADDAET